MLIECTLKRDQVVEVPMNNETYVFQPDAKGRRVAEVFNETHVECFLAIPDLYRVVPDDNAVEQRAPDPAGIIQIKGIGSRLVGILGQLDPPVTELEEIAGWSDEDVERVEGNLRFPGRIVREKWVEQAKALVAAKNAPPHDDNRQQGV